VSTDPSPGFWVEERHRGITSKGFLARRVLFEGKSPYQTVTIVETVGLGRMLLNDGMVMLSERDEFIYHEMISHVPLFVHPNPERVLIIGGGDGGTAREVLLHPEVKIYRMVEIDEMVVNACREHIPLTASVLTNPRLQLTIGDGVKFVADTDERFDVVLVDSTDPVGPAQPLFGEPFYRNVLRILNDGGVVVSQGESPFYEAETQRSVLRVLHAVFEHTHIYNFPNLTYPGGFWSFTFASQGLCPLADFDPARVAASGIHFRYYTEEIHRAAFALPAFMKDEVQDYLSSHP
jgi:spermidine synthase